MSADKITIRDLAWEESDLLQILEIENLSFNKEDAYTREDFQRWFNVNPDFCIVAEIDGQIAGNMICRIKRYRLDMGSCAIHPNYRRQGVGAALLAEMEKRARGFGIHQIDLEVRPSNISAQAFWQALGFEEFKVSPGFYPDGEDALLMSKKI